MKLHRKQTENWIGSVTLFCGALLASACTISMAEKDESSMEESSDRSESANVGQDAGTEATTDGAVSSADAQAVLLPSATTNSASSQTPTTESGERESLPTVEAGTAPTTAECARDLSSAREVTGAITDEQTWDGTILLTGAVGLRSGSKVTILPGTEVIVDVDSWLEVGWNGTEATLDAQGTAERPIHFCGKESSAGYWRSLIVGPGVTSDSVLSNVIVSDAGGENTAALVLNANILVQDVLVRDSGFDGVQAADFEADSSGLSVQGSHGAAVVLTGPRAATYFPLGGTFSENEDNSVRVRFTQINEDTSFANPGIPYVQDSNLDTRSGSLVTFASGIDYRFSTDTFLEFGWNNSDGRLEINGTEEEPVTFRGEVSEPGHWAGIIIRSNIRSDSRISHTHILHAGGDNRVPLEVNSPIVLDHVTLDNNERHAWIGGQGLSDESTDLTITGSQTHALTIDINAITSLPRGGSFTGNENDWIAIDGGSFGGQGTIPSLGVPYRVERSFDARGDSELTIEPGVVFEATADAQIEIGWNGSGSKILALGTESDPIVFRGAEARAGYWRGLLIGHGVPSDSALDYVEIGNAGQGDGSSANLRLDAPIAVSNCRFFDSQGWGILKREFDATDYTETNAFENVASGAVGTF